MRKLFFAFLAVCCLLLSVAALGLWGRSYFVGDTVGIETLDQTASGPEHREYLAITGKGGMAVSRRSGMPSATTEKLPEQAGHKTGFYHPCTQPAYPAPTISITPPRWQWWGFYASQVHSDQPGTSVAEDILAFPLWAAAGGFAILFLFTRLLAR